ncbi:hypothetical protein AB2R53_18290 [Acinetobacter baumannii]|uniref:Ribbon-helix-helix protein RHH domain-containing protein n=1 Tax=Acinetobacter baumannii TaxID=470 RepID=A0AB37ABK7_ACIBA|nr:hypothetical protein [Acinetobacter baumannii]EMT91025.1 hypothetical protein ABNIH5_08266 [Acinetobacter baumannii ABNIH5]EGT92428.1 hypothetical protein ABNIH1_10328 [Acinetobacter baumannii ABNIH1]EKT9429613.1 hypothetical protein [Acinetobacter baumannii]EKW0658876.1 hypothetical protein [Acinetobacter baumannii]EKX0059065.1 hypothetical protein [Acinetobacter baumannii]
MLSNLPIRVDQELKDTFIACCKSQDSTASQELRKFMRQYVKQYAQQDLFSKSKSANMTTRQKDNI